MQSGKPWNGHGIWKCENREEEDVYSLIYGTYNGKWTNGSFEGIMTWEGGERWEGKLSDTGVPIEGAGILYTTIEKCDMIIDGKWNDRVFTGTCKDNECDRLEDALRTDWEGSVTIDEEAGDPEERLELMNRKGIWVAYDNTCRMGFWKNGQFKPASLKKLVTAFRKEEIKPTLTDSKKVKRETTQS